MIEELYRVLGEILQLSEIVLYGTLSLLMVRLGFDG